MRTFINGNSPLRSLEDMPEVIQELFDTHVTGQILLAGGAPRDALMGQPIRDYDFFVSLSSEVGAIISRHNLTPVTRQNTLYDNPNIDSVYKIGDVDLIVTYCSPALFVRRFPITSSECWAVPTEDGWSVDWSNEFGDFMENGVACIRMNSYISSLFSSTYLPKLLFKYPNTTFTVSVSGINPRPGAEVPAFVPTGTVENLSPVSLF